MKQIQADSKKIETILQDMLALIKAHGGWIDHNLVMTAQGGALSLTLEGPVNAMDNIITMPEELLIPAEHIGLSVRDGQFVVDPDKTVITDVQAQLLDYIIALYNESDKKGWTETYCPFIALKDYPAVLDKILAARVHHEKFYETIDLWRRPKESEEELNAVICDAFLKTRVLGQKEGDNKQVSQKIMPIIDFLNHDNDGSSFNFTKEGKTRLQVASRQPIIDSRECFALYNVMDALDSYLGYYFVDTRVNLVRSVPMTINLGGNRTLQIEARRTTLNKGKTPQHLNDLRRIMPIVTRADGSDVTVVSHMMITLLPMPHAMRRILLAVIRGALGEEKNARDVAAVTQKAEREIVTKNITYYKELAQVLDDLPAAAQDLPAVAMTRDLAETQLTKLYKYLYDPAFWKQAADMT